MKMLLNRMNRPQTLPRRKNNIVSGPFSGLDGRALERYRSLGTNVHYPQGCRLFAEKDEAHSVFVLESGSVKMSTVSTEGRALILKIAGQGDILGLSAVLRRTGPGGNQYDFSAEALHPALARVVRAQEFINFLREFPGAGEAVTRTLLRDYHCTLRALRRFVFPATVAGRIADFLLEWCSDRRTAPVTFPVTHSDIAALTRTSRETVTRTMMKFRDDGLIQLRGTALTILKPEALARLTAGVMNSSTHGDWPLEAESLPGQSSYPALAWREMAIG